MALLFTETIAINPLKPKSENWVHTNSPLSNLQEGYMFKRNKHKGIEAIRQKYAYIFVTPFAIGLIMFFAFPLLSSIRYSFSEVKIEPGAVTTDFIGLANFKYLLFEDAKFVNQLVESLGLMFYSLPLILAFSLVVAIMLNRAFVGRTAMRALFFLPIVITASAVLPILGEGIVSMSIFESEGSLDQTEIINNLNIPDMFSGVITFLMSSVTDIIYKSAVQIILSRWLAEYTRPFI